MSTAPFLAPHRSDGTALGRASGFYCVPGVAIFSSTNSGLTANRDYYMPWRTDTPIVIDQLALEVTTGTTGNLRMGFYAADRAWQPLGAPIADSGSIAITEAVKTYTPGSAIYVPPGRYVSALNMDTDSSIRGMNGAPLQQAHATAIGSNPQIAHFYVSRTYAAFPTPGTAWTTTSVTAGATYQYVLYRVSAA